jgi:hypothetical protein
MGDLPKTLIIFGAVLVILGVVFLLVQKVPFLGKLPGDIVIRRENFTVYFPLGTSILISIILSLILFLIGKCR